MIVRIEDIMGLKKTEKGIAVHRDCFHRALKTWGQGKVIDHG